MTIEQSIENSSTYGTILDESRYNELSPMIKNL